MSYLIHKAVVSRYKYDEMDKPLAGNSSRATNKYMRTFNITSKQANTKK